MTIHSTSSIKYDATLNTSSTPTEHYFNNTTEKYSKIKSKHEKEIMHSVIYSIISEIGTLSAKNCIGVLDCI